MSIPIQIVNKSSFDIPKYAKDGDAGFDLQANIPESICLVANVPMLVPTGIFMAIPPGYEGQIRSRSGLSLKNVVVANTPGTVDSGYRGEIKVILVYRGNPETFYVVKPGDRIAQMVISKVEQADFILSESLDDTDRGAGGFGSTGN